ncbi:MAG: SDR family NAD(P)-dependent oxidoreductase [Acidimicrobiales bacterium]
MSVAIVTGASRGLGEALAAGLAERRWSLVLDGREAEALEQALGRVRERSGARVSAVAGDVSDPEHRAALVAAAREQGGIDLVVNNASTLGVTPLPTLADFALDELRRTYDVNALAPLALIQASLPLLRRSPDPRVLNVTSDASVEAYAGWGGYGSSKAALDHLSAVLAVEEPDIRTWAVDPGDMRTRMQQDAFPGEDITDRPPPATVVPLLLELIEGDRPSGRYRARDLGTADAC